MEKNILAGKTSLPPSMLRGAIPMLRPTTLWALQWSGPNQSLQNLMHFRYYASSMGRFLKPDNIITNIANPQSWNLYTYVNGNPANFNDPTGHLGNFPGSTKISREEPPGGSVWDVAEAGWIWDSGQPRECTSEGETMLISSDWEWELINGEWWYVPIEVHWQGPEMVVTPYRPAQWVWVGGKTSTYHTGPYLDTNVSFGSRALYGITGGFQLDKRTLKSYPYLGVGLMNYGPAASIMGSDSSITPGWNIAFQFQFLFSGQWGMAGGEFFKEKGLGYPFSVSITAYYVFDLDATPTAPPALPFEYKQFYRKAFSPW